MTIGFLSSALVSSVYHSRTAIARALRYGGRCVAAAALVLVLAGCHDRAGDGRDAVAAMRPRAPVERVSVESAPSPTAHSVASTPQPAHEPIALTEADIHWAPRDSACAPGGGRVDARSSTVHRWTDDAGIVHYSDQPPLQLVKNHRLIEVRGLSPISVQASGYDMNLPDGLQQRAVTDAIGVQRVLHEALAVAAPAQLALHIVFVRDPDAYARLLDDPALASSAGAYSTARRTIYVRLQLRDDASFAVLRHEITHALVHESIGNLPTSINEGMAEYFGRYRAAGFGGQIDIGADRAALVAAAPTGDGSGELVDLLARDGDAFYAMSGHARDRELRYLRAYALVALLMRDASGRAALTALLAMQRSDPCVPISAERLLQLHYPGGLPSLAAHWAEFMRSPPLAIQAY